MGGTGGERQEGRYTGVRGNLGVIDVFISLMVMVVLPVYSGVRTYRTVHFNTSRWLHIGFTSTKLQRGWGETHGSLMHLEGRCLGCFRIRQEFPL